MRVNDLFQELGYEQQECSEPFTRKYKKRDEMNIADTVIYIDDFNQIITGGLITIAPMCDINDIAHQYKIFLRFKKDIKSFAEELNYGII